MMPLIWIASFLTLVLLVVIFVAVLGIRLFTERRPPLVTRRAGIVGAVAVGIFLIGIAGLAASNRRCKALQETLDQLEGAGMEEVETRLGQPRARTPVSPNIWGYDPFLLRPGDPDFDKRPVVSWTYDACVWYSPYIGIEAIVYFDCGGRLLRWYFDD